MAPSVTKPPSLVGCRFQRSKWRLSTGRESQCIWDLRKVSQQWSDHQEATATPGKSTLVHCGIGHRNFESKPFLSPTKGKSLTAHWAQTDREALADGHCHARDKRKLPHLENTWKTCLKEPQTVLPLAAKGSYFLGSPPAVKEGKLNCHFITPTYPGKRKRLEKYRRSLTYDGLT